VYPEPANTAPVGPYQFLPILRSSSILQVNYIQSRDTRTDLFARPDANPPWTENFTFTPNGRTPSKATPDVQTYRYLTTEDRGYSIRTANEG
jgi:hypothetical protein